MPESLQVKTSLAYSNRVFKSIFYVYNISRMNSFCPQLTEYKKILAVNLARVARSMVSAN